MEFFNESCLQIICYQVALIPLTLTTSDEDIIGFVIIALIIFVFAANLTVMLSTTFISCKRKLLLRKLKQKYEAEIDLAFKR